MYTIQQSFIGQITVVGECFCYGVGLDKSQVVYLDMAGSATSVEAVWAKLAQGKEVAIVPLGGEKIVLRTGEGLLKRLQRKVEGVGIHHLVLLHQAMLEPVYAEQSTTYLMFADKTQATAKLGSHVQALVDIAVFPDWHPYLVQQGRVEGLLKPLTCSGGVRIWEVVLDKAIWQRLICQGLEYQRIALPTTMV